LTAEQSGELFNSIDSNGNGELTMLEFLEWYRHELKVVTDSGFDLTTVMDVGATAASPTRPAEEERLPSLSDSPRARNGSVSQSASLQLSRSQQDMAMLQSEALSNDQTKQCYSFQSPSEGEGEAARCINIMGFEVLLAAVDDSRYRQEMFDEYDDDASGTLEEMELGFFIQDLLPGLEDPDAIQFVVDSLECNGNEGATFAEIEDWFHVETKSTALLRHRVRKHPRAMADVDALRTERLANRDGETTRPKITLAKPKRNVTMMGYDVNSAAAADTKGRQGLFNEYDDDESGCLDSLEVTFFVQDLLPGLDHPDAVQYVVDSIECADAEAIKFEELERWYTKSTAKHVVTSLASVAVSSYSSSVLNSAGAFKSFTKNKKTQAWTKFEHDPHKKFMEYDRDHTGSVDHMEAVWLLQDLLAGVSKEEAEQLYSCVPRAAADEVSYEEFTVWISHPNQLFAISQRLLLFRRSQAVKNKLKKKNAKPLHRRKSGRRAALTVYHADDIKRMQHDVRAAAVLKRHPLALNRLNELTVWDPPAKPRCCMQVTVWVACLAYIAFLTWYLILYSLHLRAAQGRTWMETSGMSLGQSLFVSEPVKFFVIAFIMTCMPDRAKSGCVKCLQACAMCGAVVAVLVGVTLAAMADNIEIDAAFDAEDQTEDVEVDGLEDEAGELEVEADGDADGDMDGGEGEGDQQERDRGAEEDENDADSVSEEEEEEDEEEEDYL